MLTGDYSGRHDGGGLVLASNSTAPVAARSAEGHSSLVFVTPAPSGTAVVGTIILP